MPLGRTGRPPRRVALLVLLAGLAAGCGLKTPPRPAELVLPPTEGVQVRQREGQALISWLPSSPNEARPFGGVEGYRLWVLRLPLFCESCPPEEERTFKVPAASPRLRREGARIYLALPIEGAPAVYKVRLATVFGSGQNAPSPPHTMTRMADIPAPALRWRRLSTPRDTQPRPAKRVLFYWRPRQEGVTRVVGQDGHPREQALFFRANLYRRAVGGAWPLSPLNPEPIGTGRWEVAPGPPGSEEYRLRWVDRLGGEGPPSPSVRLSAEGAGP